MSTIWDGDKYLVSELSRKNTLSATKKSKIVSMQAGRRKQNKDKKGTHNTDNRIQEKRQKVTYLLINLPQTISQLW